MSGLKIWVPPITRLTCTTSPDVGAVAETDEAATDVVAAPEAVVVAVGELDGLEDTEGVVGLGLVSLDARVAMVAVEGVVEVFMEDSDDPDGDSVDATELEVPPSPVSDLVYPRVHRLTSSTAGFPSLSVMGVRVMTHVSVNGPAILYKKVSCHHK